MLEVPNIIASNDHVNKLIQEDVRSINVEYPEYKPSQRLKSQISTESNMLEVPNIIASNDHVNKLIQEDVISINVEYPAYKPLQRLKSQISTECEVWKELDSSMRIDVPLRKRKSNLRRTSSVKRFTKACQSIVSPNKTEAPDGGYGWVIVICCAIMYFLKAGITRTYGITFIAMQDKYGISALFVTSIYGMFWTTSFLVSPIATTLSSYYSTRNVCIVGSIFMSVGCILTSLMSRPEYLFFTYSIMIGIGYSLTGIPSHILISEYFCEKFGLAIGLATSGAGIGGLVFPHFIGYLSITYSFSGTMLILGGIVANCIVVSLLLRPLKTETNLHVEETQNNESIEQRPGIDIKERLIKKLKTLKRNIFHWAKFVHVSLLTDRILLSVTSSLAFIEVAYLSAYLIFPSLLNKSYGYSMITIESIMSIIGCSDMIGRFSIGYLFGFLKKTRNKIKVYIIIIFLLTVLSPSWILFNSLALLIISSILIGLLNGGLISQKSVVFREFFGQNQLGSACAFSELFMGPMVLFGPFITGYLMDVFDSFVAPYSFICICCCVSSFLFLLAYCFHRQRSPELYIKISVPVINVHDSSTIKHGTLHDPCMTEYVTECVTECVTVM